MRSRRTAVVAVFIGVLGKLWTGDGGKGVGRFRSGGEADPTIPRDCAAPRRAPWYRSRVWRTAMDWQARITIEPDKRFGKPCIRGMRITVGDILGWLAAGSSEDEILSEFPQLEREDIRAALAFAADREQKTMVVLAAQ